MLAAITDAFADDADIDTLIVSTLILLMLYCRRY